VDLTIITPTFNHRDYIEALYESLRVHSTGLAWEWLVADSGDDDTGAFLEALDDPRIRHVRVARMSYGAVNNEMAARARSPFLLFLNNDTRVTEGWWQGPLSLLREPPITIVGSVLWNDDGTLQSAGMGVCTHDPHSFNFLKVPRWPRGPSDGWLVPAVTGACLFCTRSGFAALGGFDRVFGGGYYEDTDLCMRAYAAGRMIVISATSHVVHKARGSLDVSRAFWHAIPANRRAFRDRWNIVLGRLEGVGPLPLRAQKMESAVCINPWLTALGGGEREFTWAVDFLFRYCGKVTVCGADDGVQRALADRFTRAFPPEVALESTVRVNAAHTIVWDQTYYDIKTSYTTSRRIHLKRVMFGPTRKPLARGPHFIFNSSYTRTSLRPTSAGTVVYPPVGDDGLLCTAETMGPKKRIVLSVGRFAQRRRYLNWKNQEALIRFFHRWRNGSDFRLVLAGNVNDENHLLECAALASSGPAASRIALRPGISAAELRRWLRDSMFYVSFAGYERRTAAQAEHFGMAVVEAMAAGCVCVACAAGGHLEIIDHGVDGFLWKREADLTRLLTRLAHDEKLRTVVALRARQKARQFAPMFAELQIRQILHQGRVSSC
jgi:glycosyltransferase involved in cell wall biosynthesis